LGHKRLSPESSAPIGARADGGNAPAQRSAQSTRPVLPPDIKQFFMPVGGAAQPDEDLVYFPRLIAAGDVRFQNARLQVNEQQQFLLAVDPDGISGASVWADAMEPDVDPAEFARQPEPGATFSDCPTELTSAKQITAWEKSLRRWWRAEGALRLYKSKTLKESSRPGESERDFRIRLQQLGNEQRDLKVAKLRERFERKVVTQEGRLLRAQQTLERQSEQASAQKLDAALSFGTAILGALLGRKRVSVTSASRAGTAVRKAGRIGKESADVRRAEQTVAAVQSRITELQLEFDDKVVELDDAYDAQTEELVESQVRPRAADINIELIGIGWFAYREDEDGRLRAV